MTDIIIWTIFTIFCLGFVLGLWTLLSAALGDSLNINPIAILVSPVVWIVLTNSTLLDFLEMLKGFGIIIILASTAMLGIFVAIEVVDYIYNLVKKNGE